MVFIKLIHVRYVSIIFKAVKKDQTIHTRVHAWTQ